MVIKRELTRVIESEREWLRVNESGREVRECTGFYLIRVHQTGEGFETSGDHYSCRVHVVFIAIMKIEASIQDGIDFDHRASGDFIKPVAFCFCATGTSFSYI